MRPLSILLLIVISLAPPILFLFWLREAERHRREPYRVLARAFGWGAIAAALLAILAQGLLSSYFGERTFLLPTLTIMIVLVAPVVEELAKALGLRLIHDHDPEPEDGYIYGGAVGLGFAATENTIYVLDALVFAGEQTALATALYRGIATVALHGAATAIAGHGIWRARYGGRPWWALWGIGAAIGLHVAYNALSALSVPWATLLAAAVAVLAYLRMMRRVRVLDARGSSRS